MVFQSDPKGWADPRHRQGAEGEAIAAAYLRGRGWRILEERFRMGRLEIDLIARKDNIVAFVEVKTRTTTRFGRPIEAVTWGKQREIGRVAQAWVDRHRNPADIYRFDVIGILERAGRREIEHIPDAFRFNRSGR